MTQQEPPVRHRVPIAGGVGHQAGTMRAHFEQYRCDGPTSLLPTRFIVFDIHEDTE
jgi:hypothetical protein